MLAGVLHGSHDLRLEQVTGPEPRPDGVVVQVARVGICGSDVHYFLHGECGAFVPSSPFILGHEFVGVVRKIGSKVRWPRIGDRVVVNPAASCGHCEACIGGRGNLCPDVVMLGSGSTTPPTNGAFAESVAVPARQCYILPESVDDAQGAMMEPLSVALHAISRAGGVVAKRVLVTGGGPIGLIAAIAARALGAALVAVSEPSEGRRDLAKLLGVDHVLDARSERLGDSAIKLSDGGFDILFEASGAKRALQTSIDVVRRGGVIVQIGTIADPEVGLPVNTLMVRELALLGTFRYADEFPEAIRLVASGRIDLAPLVTGVYPLREIERAMAAACDSEGMLKVQIAAEV